MADRLALTTSVLAKWQAQALEQPSGFIRFLDGSKANYAVANMVFVTLPQCLQHFDGWVTDWDRELTEEEAALVRDPEWRKTLGQ